ncbi:hypothetical protein GCM10012320_08610 [Sinomonas cellulolyticus]|uniref:DUF4233 domain-containing protein n=1 Tax=Sinomonas cellulolyticus TaxID=2801916 RepID=A0ABS1K3S8_9MICC|nr:MULTISPECIES: DUF4233 domain-containing protein [Sinomonas]MBL0706321.1 DUF4233 domain-containing protein [Sinomonas cellulolyticus]GHG44050.1 hypothetical protein GCM10012320_08610 [Sinomonas sp. KCTC 49339]
MARLTRAQREWRPDMPKKRRSVRVMFASILLLTEAFVVFFATLVLFGLRARELGAGPVLGGGLGLMAVFVLACAVVSRPWGMWLAWALQLVLVALGFFEPMMFVVGGALLITWFFAVRTGARLDRENVHREREQAEWDRTHPDDA